MIHSFQTILTYSTQRLQKLYPDKSASTNISWYFIEAITKKSRTQLLATKYNLTSEELSILSDWLHKHIELHMPLQYLIGMVPFCGLELYVEPPVLIPRPETEQWVDDFITMIKLLPAKNIQNLKILDLCTGSGCIALAIANALPQAAVIGIDNAPHALALANKNKAALNLTNVNFILSDLYTKLTPDQSFDFIVANPPYISLTEWQSLELRVQQWEDQAALWTHDDGLACITAIIKNAPAYIKAQTNTPQLFLEIGYNQGQACRALAQKLGYTACQIKKDYSDNDRVFILYAENI